ncbi:MAG: hemerythrin domain-containing protein [Alphaproteobacteria bacterium]|nr:hemerythrin domain-containing protein [Alphaproteobacteria bacterium]
MAETLRMLREEHANLWQLLNLIDAQLDAFDRNESVDYELLHLVLQYCQSFPDRFHHPKEDLILERLRERAPAVAASFETLENEHKLLAEETNRFADRVEQVVQDSQVPRTQLTELGRAFVTSYRRHMKFEEDVFFPAAEKHLEDGDWTRVDAHLHEPADPLFGDQAVETYRRLRDIISA